MTNPTASRIAIIGSGISGAACAVALAQAGFSVSVFEKARGVGGRFSVRRLGGGVSLPTGAALLPDAEPSQHEWSEQLGRWRAAGLIARAEGGWTAMQGMNALVKDQLAQGDSRIETRTSTRIVRLERDGGCVRLHAEGPAQAKSAIPVGEFNAVVLTAPLPQALELLDASGLGKSFPEALRHVTYTRSVVSFLRFSPGILPTAPREVSHRLADGALLELAGDCAVWKSGAPFAAQLWDSPDLESRSHREALEALNRRGVSVDEAAIVERSFHRWKYARVENPLLSTFVRLEGSGAPLVLAGDAFGSSADAASAFLSGVFAALELIRPK